jgi:hypothetical protein
LVAATNLQKEYSDGYKSSAQWEDYSQLPVIGGAAVAAWILLNQHSNAAKKAGKVGIATTAYSAARGQLLATGMSDAYLSGYGALTCILAEGPIFSGPDARNQNRDFESAIKGLENQINLVSELRNRIADPRKIKAQTDALKAAYAVADQAMTNARTAEASSLKQLAAWHAAPAMFRNAVSSVSVTVASKGRVRPPVDFNTLKTAMAPSAGGAAAAARGGAKNNELDLEALIRAPAPSDDPKIIIQDLMRETNALTTLTAQLSGNTPDYLGSLSTVQDCAKKM